MSSLRDYQMKRCKEHGRWESVLLRLPTSLPTPKRIPLLADRLRTSFILICVALASLYVDAVYSPSRLAGIGTPDSSTAGLYLIPLLCFFAYGTARDLCGLLGGVGFPVQRMVTIAGSVAVALSPSVVMLWNAAAIWLPGDIGIYPPDCPIGQMGWIAIAMMVVISCLFLVEMKAYGPDSDTGRVLRRLAAGIFIVAYVGISMSFLVMIRSLGHGNWGLAALLTMIATTKSTDAGAYFSGKAFGKHKLIPRLSPGKTWEGAIGGTLVATIVAIVCLMFLFPAMADGSGLSGGVAEPVARPDVLIETDLVAAAANTGSKLPPLALALILGPVLAISGMIGDLAQSLVKRACKAKDSGNLLPGLGGVWDVTDSLIFASLPAFLCFVAVA